MSLAAPRCLAGAAAAAGAPASSSDMPPLLSLPGSTSSSKAVGSSESLSTACKQQCSAQPEVAHMRATAAVSPRRAGALHSRLLCTHQTKLTCWTCRGLGAFCGLNFAMRDWLPPAAAAAAVTTTAAAVAVLPCLYARSLLLPGQQKLSVVHSCFCLAREPCGKGSCSRRRSVAAKLARSAKAECERAAGYVKYLWTFFLVFPQHSWKSNRHECYKEPQAQAQSMLIHMSINSWCPLRHPTAL